MSSAPVSLSASGPLAHQWLAVACAADVEGAPVAVKVLGRDLVLWRSPNGSVVAAPDRCTHSKGELTKGEVNKGLLACPKHGWTFGDQGRCVFKPSGLPINERAHLKTHQTTERYGLIWVSLEDPTGPLIDLGWDGDNGYRRIHSSVSVWKSNPITIIETLLAQSDSHADRTTADLPFVLHGRFQTPHETDNQRILSCAPIDSRHSLVSSVVYTSDRTPDTDKDVLSAALADWHRAKPIAEDRATTVPTIEIGSDESADTAEWKRGLLAFFDRTAA